MTEEVEGYLAGRFDGYVDELRRFCAIPSVSTQPSHRPDVLRAARFVADRLAAAGLADAAVHPTAGHPVVTAAWRGGDGGRRPCSSTGTTTSSRRSRWRRG